MPVLVERNAASPPRPARGAPYPWRAFLWSAAALALSCWLVGPACRWQASLPLKPSTDLLLEALPRWDASALLTWGWFALHGAAFLGFLRWEPRRLPFIMASMALFVMVRNVFLALTPVAPPSGLLPLYAGGSLDGLRGSMVFDNEIFFSGHTGMPFLYYLLARGPVPFKFSFLAVSLAMGAGVLLTRNHYAIDVLAAFPITYSLHALSRRLFDRPENA